MTEREVFFEALEIATPEARAAYLQGACGRDVTLRRKVDELLKEHFSNDSLMARPALEGERNTAVDSFVQDAPARMIGRYKPLEKIGEGGFGEVWMAEQRLPVKRRVALKIIKPGMDSRQIVARFEAERQALAMMDHANIARIFDADVTDNGRLYFVMELVRGVKITEYCDQNQLPTQERLRLFILVCQAIQHAHQKGIIHCDIKPSNILVTLHDGVPVPKVIDFGIAKATQQELTDKTVFTQFQQFIGTPAYISPEQAEMSGLDIDTRSDIYSLGVMLYELLAGSTPFDARELMSLGIDAMRKTIREKDPVRPSTKLATLQGDELTTTAKRRSVATSKLAKLLRGDLDWIVMKCLEKDRTRRYETANGLAADLKRHLNNEPVVARPPSTTYRLQKAWRRNKLAFTASAAVVATLVVALAVSSWQMIRATRAEREQKQLRTLAETARAGEATQRQQAEEARAHETRLRMQAQLEAYAADMKAAQVALAQNSRGQAAELLDRYRPGSGKPDLRGIEWRYLWQQARGGEAYVWQHPSIVVGARFSPDGSRLVTACFDGFIRVWDFASRKLLTQMNRGVRDDIYVVSFVFSPDGKTLVSADQEGFVMWDTTSWNVVRRLDVDLSATPNDMNGSNPLAFSPDGRLLAAASPGKIRIWDVTNWQFRTITTTCARSMAFMPDNRTLVLSDGVRISSWDVTAQAENPLPPPSRADRVQSMALTKDGAKLAATTWSGELEWRDGHTLQVTRSQLVHRTPFHAIAFSPDEKTLATGGFDQDIHLLDVATGELRGTLRGHLNEVWSVEFSPDGRWLVSTGKDGTARLWDMRQVHRPEQFWLPIQRSEAAGFGSDGVQVVSHNTNRTLQYWDLTNVVRSLDLDRNAVGRPLLSSDGRRVMVRTRDGTIKTFNEAGSELGRVVLTSGVGWLMEESADHRWLALVIGDENINIISEFQVVEAASGNEVATFPYPGQFAYRGGFSFSHDSRWAAYSGTNFSIKVWDMAAHRDTHTLNGHMWHINTVAFSADDRYLASAGWDGDARVWDMKTGTMAAGPLRGHGSGIRQVTFSPDGKTLVTAGDDNTVRFWHLATGREMLVLEQANSAGIGLVSPNGERLVVWDTARDAVRVERIPTLAEISEEELGRNSGGRKP